MNVLWYVQRLSRMSAAEMARRARDQGLKLVWRARRVRDAAADPLEVPSDLPPFASPLSPDVARALPEAARARMVAAADELLAGRWPVFDRLRHDMAPVPDWFLDPLTGVRAPQDRNTFAIDYRREDQVGNIKYVWELSRHHHVTVLAAAYHASGDARYAEAAARQLTSWWQANPFLSGVHWTSGIELGVRLIAWVWTRRLLDGWSDVRALFEDNRVFLQQLHHHQEFLAAFPSHGSSANNHVLAEAAGQFAACCAFPYFRETERWRRKAALILDREIPAQTFPSGLNRELATDYHSFVIELCLVAALEGEASGHSLGPEIWRQIRDMIDALAAVLDTRGRPPRQGDGDDGTALLLDAPGYQRWWSLIATGEDLFGTCDWWPPVPRDDARTPYWTAIGAPPGGLGRRPAARPAPFEDAGVVLLRAAAGSKEEIWCRCDHGPHGFLSIAAHAHADALSVEVRCAGVDILADPGTFCYQGEPEWRRYTRATIGHNTLELAGVDQSVSGGPFLWTRHARSTLEQVSGLHDGPVAEWQASHDGYSRLDPPAVHRRAVRLERDIRRLVIDDSVECAGQHPCRLTFHLGPEIECELENGEAQLAWTDENGHHSATLRLPAALAWTRVRGQTEPPLGWYAESFRKRVPTTTLLGMGTIGGGGHLVTEVLFGAEPE